MTVHRESNTLEDIERIDGKGHEILTSERLLDELLFREAFEGLDALVIIKPTCRRRAWLR